MTKVDHFHTWGDRILALLQKVSDVFLPNTSWDVSRPDMPSCFCLSRSSLFLGCIFFFFFSLSGLIWLAAGTSQRRCRPKQPGLKWLCECSVRDSFRACGKTAHSLLTVEMRGSKGGKGREEVCVIWADRKGADVKENVLDIRFPFLIHSHITPGLGSVMT